MWSGRSEADYLEIISYVAAENPDAAARLADKVTEAGRSLAQFSTGREGRVTNTYERVATGSPYIIPYEITAEADEPSIVSILRVIHGACDWQKDRWPK